LSFRLFVRLRDEPRRDVVHPLHTGYSQAVA
jgi:hypothetical protein